MAAPSARSAPPSSPRRALAVHWRRLARPASVALLVGALSSAAFGGASASRGWCRADPEVRIGGQTAHVHLDLDVPNMHVAQQLGVGQPIRIVLTVPRDIDARLLAVDRGFGQGYDIDIQPSSMLRPANGIIPVKVDALIPLQDDDLAVRVAFVPAGSASDERQISRHGRGHGRETTSGGRLAAASSAGTANRWVSVLADR